MKRWESAASVRAYLQRSTFAAFVKCLRRSEVDTVTLKVPGPSYTSRASRFFLRTGRCSPAAPPTGDLKDAPTRAGSADGWSFLIGRRPSAPPTGDLKDAPTCVRSARASSI